MQNLRPRQADVYGMYNQLLSRITVLLITCFLSATAFAQTYTSNFATPAGNYSSISPSGGTCITPGFAGAANVADADLTNYASVSGTLSAAILCDNTIYSIRTKLNFPGGTTFAPAGYQAGFRVSLASALSVSVLGSNMSLRTYLGGVEQETVLGANVIGISLLSSPGPTDIYFTSALPFDEVELIFNTAVIPINVLFDYRIYNAFGAISVLPVGFNGLSAKIAAGRLNVDWETISEKDNDRFVVQGSSDGKTWNDLGTIASKANGGNSSVKISYNYSMPWSGTVMAGFGLLGLLFLPAVRSRLMKLVVLVLVLAAVVSCAKERDGFDELQGGASGAKPMYVRVAQIDKDGSVSHSGVVVAKR